MVNNPQSKATGEKTFEKKTLALDPYFLRATQKTLYQFLVKLMRATKKKMTFVFNGNAGDKKNKT